MADNTIRFLIISEFKHRIRQFKEAIQDLGSIQIASSGYDGLQLLALDRYYLVLLDYDVSLMNGKDTLTRIRKEHPEIPVIIMPAEGRFVKDVADSIDLGAQMFLSPDMAPDTMRQIIESILYIGPIPEKVAQIRITLQKMHRVNNLIGSSREMFQVYERLEKIVDSAVSVLIQGESGTGKELVARLVHSMSPRAGRNFIALNCAAIPENLLESELFGHEKGAFTGAALQRKGKFELADGGTLFLDEIGDMSPILQAKLLRVLEHGTFERVGGDRTLRSDVRIISATNKNLSELIHQGQFREDLYYRLNVFSVEIPPLRERTADIALLTIYFVHKFNQKNNRKIRYVSDNVIRALQSYHWPGNIRELQNVIEQSIILAETDRLTMHDLPRWVHQGAGMHRNPENFQVKGAQKAFENSREIYPLAEIELAAIQKAVELTGGNISKAADELGVSRVTLYRKMDKYSIDIRE